MSKKVTMKDIAQELGISINAVSLALNNRVGVSDELRLNVLRAADALGYINGNSRFLHILERHSFCIMIQNRHSQDDIGFYGRVLYGVVEESRRKGYDTVLNYFDDKNMIVPNCIEMRKVSGICIIGMISTENVKTLQSFNIPVVLIDHQILLSNIHCILTDNKSGGFIAAKHLIDSGFKKIGFFGDLAYSFSVQDRFLGFLEALKREGIVKNNWHDEYISMYSITGSVEQHIINNDFDAITKILAAQKALPEAFFCSNDSGASVLIRALNEINLRVPDDISVIGFDNIFLCEKTTPNITTINVNKEAMGQRAVSTLVRLKEQKAEIIENTVLGVELVERASVKPKFWKF